jgi:YVTN family beta-propeller protein
VLILVIRVWLTGGDRAHAAPFAYVSAGDLVIIDLATDASVVVPLGATAGGVTGNVEGSRVYVVHEGAGFVSVVDTASNLVIDTIAGVGGGPHAGVKMAVSLDGNRLYVPNFTDGTVSVVDTDTNSVVDTFSSGSGTIAVAATPDGSRLYASNLDANTVAVIDATNGARIVDIPLAGGPDRLAIDPSGTRAYVPLAYGTALAIIDLATNTTLPPIGIGGYPVWAAVSPDGQKVFVSSQNTSLVVVNTGSNSVTATLPVGALASGLAVTPDGSRVYVAAPSSNNLTIIDASTEQVVGTRPTVEGIGTEDVFISSGPPSTTTTSVTSSTTTSTSSTTSTTLFEQPIGSRRLLILDHQETTRRRIAYVSRDPSLDTTSGTGVNPVADGALLHVYSTAAQNDSACFSLPAAMWRQVGEPEQPTFRYLDRDFVAGPCQKAVLKHGRVLAARCVATIQPIAYSLDEAAQVNVGVEFISGSIRYCSILGGEHVRNTQGRLFTAKDAPQPTSCPQPAAPCP